MLDAVSINDSSASVMLTFDDNKLNSIWLTYRSDRGNFEPTKVILTQTYGDPVRIENRPDGGAATFIHGDLNVLYLMMQRESQTGTQTQAALVFRSVHDQLQKEEEQLARLRNGIQGY